MGIEPTTFGTTTRRSNQMSYTRQSAYKTEVIIEVFEGIYNSYVGFSLLYGVI